MMMMSIADNRCSLCRGEASTSTTRCQCPAPTRCINCGVPKASTLCTGCKALARCRLCGRYLPQHCFLQYDDDNVSDSSEATGRRSTDCLECIDERRRDTVLRSTGKILAKIEIPTTDAVHRSFENFIRIHEDQIRTRVDEFRQLHR